jgi:predicted RNA-binding Zn ribbon-like protein
MLEESRAVENFDFNSGRLCLDFINTLSDRWREAPIEVLATYADLLAWSQLAGILGSEQARKLEGKAEQQPALAALWLCDIKQTREGLYQIFSKISNGEPASAEDICSFNRLLSQTMTHLSLFPNEDGFTWSWNDEGNSPMLPLWFVTRDAADLLTSPELRLVRICASDNCDWLFLDTSKNHSRRWCDMKVCGNRAKARRYYGRQKLATE